VKAETDQPLDLPGFGPMPGFCTAPDFIRELGVQVKLEAFSGHGDGQDLRRR